MGNICRSPSAEGWLRLHAARQGLDDHIEVDSAGTHGYHIGAPPDPRAVAAMSGHGADISGYRARKVTAQDFSAFDLVVAMDEANHAQLERLAASLDAAPRARLVRMMAYAPESAGVREVPDPYYGDMRDFEHMCALLDAATRGLLDSLRPELAAGGQGGQTRPG